MSGKGVAAFCADILSYILWLVFLVVYHLFFDYDLSDASGIVALAVGIAYVITVFASIWFTVSQHTSSRGRVYRNAKYILQLAVLAVGTMAAFLVYGDIAPLSLILLMVTAAFFVLTALAGEEQLPLRPVRVVGVCMSVILAISVLVFAAQGGYSYAALLAVREKTEEERYQTIEEAYAKLYVADDAEAVYYDPDGTASALDADLTEFGAAVESALTDGTPTYIVSESGECLYEASHEDSIIVTCGGRYTGAILIIDLSAGTLTSLNDTSDDSFHADYCVVYEISVSAIKAFFFAD